MKTLHLLLICSLLTMLTSVHAAPEPRSASETRTKAADIWSAVPSKGNVTYQVWEDSRRGRSIPVKIYMPPFSAEKSPAPVLVFSHGLGGTREAAAYLGDYLSARGYVCVHIQHEGSDSGVWRPIASQGRAAILAQMKSAANASNLKLRIDDVSFVLDELERRNKSDALLGSKLNLSAIGLAGHSFGAGTTLALAGQNYLVGTRTLNYKDPRIKAAVYLSPPANLRGHRSNEIFGSIQIPGLLMTGTNDYSPIGETTAQQRILPFQGISAPGQYLVNFQGGDHMIFSGHSNPSRVQSDENYQRMISKVTGAFLDAYLKGDEVQRKWLKHECGVYLGNAAEFQSK